jgi:small subunit ribosomal protein S1
MESLMRFLEKACRRYGLEQQYAQAPAADGRRDEVGQPSPGAPNYEGGRRAAPSEVDVAWQRATQVFQEGQVVKGIVTGWNRGGLLVRWDELQGFVPASQLKDAPVFDNDDSRDEKLARWVGEELPLKVIELDRNRNRLVFSERATIWGPKDGERLLSQIMSGEVRHGHVSNLCDFGVFVDLGGVDGLVHISELSWGRVTHPRELVTIGQELEVYVLNVDRENRRIALSLKRLHPDPWTVVDQKYRLGQVIPATITNIVDFGAFARIEDGLEGLVHISELAETPVSHPAEVVSTGEQVQVRILRIDSANHRLGLSMRQIAQLPLGDAEPEGPALDGQTDLSTSQVV